MEKKNVKLGTGFKMNELMMKGRIFPDCSVCSVIQIKGSRLQIELESALADPRSIYIGFYDEAMSGCYAVCDGYVVSKNVIAFNFDGEFVKLLSAAGAAYYRMCVAVEYENEYSCFYVQSRNYVPSSDDVDYRGALCVSAQSGKTLAAYFSKGGRLSAKVVESKKFFNDFYKVEISALKKQDNGIELELICKSSDNQIVEPYLVSFDGKTNIPLAASGGVNNALSAELKFSDLQDRSFTHYILKAKINGVSVDTKWSRGVQIDGCSLYDPISFSANGENHSISCANASKTFEFDYIEKYYSAVFSVIIAVYNTELFVAEAIESILAQDTAPIAKAIAADKSTVYGGIYELILVDDGSTDSSGEICDRYAEKYPQVKVIHKENGGVSSARNLGIENAGGKYLNFLDSDDKFSENVFKECFAFFEKHYNEVNILAFPMMFFEGKTGGHWLNFKFDKGNRIIDYNSEYDKTVVSTSSAVLKSDAVKGKFFFKENMITGEDCQFLYQILFETIPKIGVVNTCTYWYRRRSVGEASAINSSKQDKNYYFQKLDELLDWAAKYHLEKSGEVPQYVQYLIAQDIQWKIILDQDAEIARSVLNEEEFQQYKDHLAKLLTYVDDKIILEQKKIYREQKMYMLKLKYQCDPDKYFINNDIVYHYNGNPTFPASTCVLRLDFLEIHDGRLMIEGYNMSFEKDRAFFVQVNGEFLPVKKVERNKNVLALGEDILFSCCFKFELELDKNISEYSVAFYEMIDGNYIQKTNIRYGKFVPLSETYSKSYYSSENRIVIMENKVLKVRGIENYSNSLVSSLSGALEYEKAFIDEISQSSSYKTDNIKKAVAMRNRVVTLKSMYDKIPHKQIWLVSDRVNMAGDNGEALFEYLQKKNDFNIDVYFVIGDQCNDYERMKQYGKVLVQNSDEHKIMHLLADFIVSAQADDYVINPFISDKTTEIFKDMIYAPKFIFLQHGIIKDDLSDWLNKYAKNITGFVTSVTPEYQSILNCQYFYTEKEVWLTGLPRYDRLYNDPKRYITIMPTWRKFLAKPVPGTVGVNDIIDNFSESNFFGFYNSLLNNERLLTAAKEHNYTVCFMPHPNLRSAVNKFDKHPDVLYFDLDKSYREVFAESDMMITDYSSSVMDFAYLRKPIAYCQFDREEFFSGKHTYVEGYFDYETDGFGELTFDIDSLIDVIIEYMKNGCTLKQTFRDRIDAFFAFNDKNNCERVYKKLKEIK